ncbi:SDR family NAD(P)-dependent oxidoreductase [Paracidovorax avenae]|uniref:SDR family NAD(P)-dependent oxidoreductase n=1 Tax=Paracidovorax avenae TaxID=80867 RepID=UPI000D17C234|nr:SDR family NAD(P)-dependent oxidoreductase [Paracidovorax avenae]AVS78618.1 oxidoreductase [Paracidovorax avenae]AVT10374.1 oxidoreductase [Paracidovorax avenae]AVT21267.1 oxidoreductase [Paracidovorax avenae]
MESIEGNREAMRPLAVVTGASSGIGLELARCAARGGYNLVLAADTPLNGAADALRAEGAEVEFIQVDLATAEGLEKLWAVIGDRMVHALMANAGHGLGGAFLDQPFADVRHVIDTNVTGTVWLVQRVAQRMCAAGRGRILITGSIAGFLPGSFQAVYNGTKAFVDSFAAALRDELQDCGVTVTCLMPGVTDTAFFERAGMLDTKFGTQSGKSDPAEVARTGYAAMEAGEADVVVGLGNKLQVALAKMAPSQLVAAQHRRMAEPGTADR